MKKIIIGVLIFGILILSGVGYYFINNSSKNTIQKGNNDIETVTNIDKAAEKVFLDKEIQTKINFLNKALKPNYLKITKYKEYKKLGKYTDKGITFYKMSIDYDINNKALADYDIYINKGSISEADFNSKSTLYKNNLERKMKIIYYKANGYDKLKNVGIIGYIQKGDGNIYNMYEMGDYIKNTFGNKTKNITTLGQIEILKDYFNYQPIFFTKKSSEIFTILKQVKKTLKNDKFDELYDVLKVVYFKNLK